MGKKVLVISIAYLLAKMLIHLAQKTLIALLLIKKITVLDEYLDFDNVFSKNSAAKSLKCFDINKHSINLELNKQPSYKQIYSLGKQNIKS